MRKFFLLMGLLSLSTLLMAADKWTGQNLYNSTNFYATAWGYYNDGKPVTNNNTVYLWNVGAGREGSDTPAFLNVGGHWGVEASLFHIGIPLYLYYKNQTSIAGRYRYNYNLLTSPNNDGNVQNKIGHITANINEYGVTMLADEKGVMTDRRDEDNDPLRNNGFRANWCFYDTGDGDNTYWICYSDNLGWHYLMRNPDRSEGRKNVVVCNIQSTAEAKANAYSKWKVVSKQDLINNFDNTPANYYDLADASFYVYDQNFTRNNGQESKWQKNGTGTIRFSNARDKDTNETTTEKDVYTVGTRSTDVMYTSMAKGGKIWYNIPYGQFYNAEIKGGTGKVYQVTEPVVKAGYYIVSCQGFYRPGDGSNAQNAYLYAKAANAVLENSDLWATAKLPHISSVPSQPTDLTESGMKFAASQENYSCKVIVWVNQNSTLEFGVALDKSTGNQDEWTAFDNVEIKYMGTDFLVAQNFNTSNLYTDTELKYQMATIRRSFVLGQWNSIVLPVTLNRDQVMTAFGTDVELAELTGLDAAGINIAFKKVDLNAMKWTDEAIKVNKAYLIKLNKEPRDFSVKWAEPVNAEVGGPYYLAPGVSFRKADLNSNPTVFTNTKGQKITLHPTYYWLTDQAGSATQKVSANESNYIYALNNGALTRFTHDFNYFGLRWWLEYSDAPTAARFQIYDDNMTTGIQTIREDKSMQSAARSKGIYTLGGQRLKDTSGKERLPMGTYIIEGKKVVVY